MLENFRRIGLQENTLNIRAPTRLEREPGLLGVPPRLSGFSKYCDIICGRRPVADNETRTEMDRARTKRLNGSHVMADKQHGSSCAGDFGHFAKAFFLKLGVADRQDFVDNENLGLEMGGDGEGEAHIHAARIALDRRIEESLDFGEGDDLVEFPVGSPPGSCRGSRR